MTVSAPRCDGRVQLLQLVVDLAGDGRVADVGVDLAGEPTPMAIGSSRREVDRVGRDDHAAAGDLVADQFRVEGLAAGDVVHLVGDDALAGRFDLRHGERILRDACRSASSGTPPGPRFSCVRARSDSLGITIPSGIVKVVTSDVGSILVSRVTLVKAAGPWQRPILSPARNESCSEQAAYKIAARWTDGRLAELKTYGFACSEHVGDVFRESLVAAAALHSRARRNDRGAGDLPVRAGKTRPLPATIVGVGRELPFLTGALPRRSAACRATEQSATWHGSVPKLRCASVTNGATGAAIARRTALGFPSCATRSRSYRRDDIKGGQAGSSTSESARKNKADGSP